MARPASHSPDEYGDDRQNGITGRETKANVPGDRREHLHGRHGNVASSGLVSPQEAEELDTFTQTPRHHVPTGQHLFDYFPDLARPEIEALVEHFHAVKYLFFRQMRIADCGQLHALVVDQIDGIVLLQPAVVDRLLV